MKVDKFNKRNTRFAPWGALCVLGLIATMVFAVPSVVFAQIIGELSQECDVAIVGTEHTITALVTQDGVPGASVPVFFYSMDSANYGKYMYVVSGFDENGIATFTYTADSVNQVDISLIYVKQDGTYEWVPMDTVTTTWTANEADLCSDSPGVTVGGKVTLNVKKKGALRIAVCTVDGSDVSNVDPGSVRLVGVAPFHSKQKDSRLCPDGKDGVKDLVLKFKNREVVQALEDSEGELVDGQEVILPLTGMNDGKAFDVTWEATIKKKGKKHHHKKHHKKEHKKNKLSKK